MPLQGWPNTRVVLDDRKQGRVLLVQPGDSSAALSKVSVPARPAYQLCTCAPQWLCQAAASRSQLSGAHVMGKCRFSRKALLSLLQVQEVAAMLENQLGLQSVWLLAGTWQVHVYNHLALLQSHVTLCLLPFAACPAAPGCPGCFQLCCTCTHLLSRQAVQLCLQAFLYVTPASRLVGCVVAEPLSHAYAVMLPGTASALPQQQRQAAGRGPGEGAPEPQPQGSTAGAACSPQLPGALQTAGRQGQPVCPTADSAEQPPWPSAAMPPSSSGRGTQAAGHSHWALPVHPGSSGKPLPGVLTPGGGTQGAGGPSLQACSPQDSSQAEDCRHQAAASAHPGRQRSDPAAMGSISRGAGQAIHPQDSSQPDNCRDQAVSPSQGPPGKQRSDTAATGSISRGGGQAVCPQPSQMAVIMDTSRRMPASCGIRAVWTSVESRRQGVATKLLDACRSDVLSLELCMCISCLLKPPSSCRPCILQVPAVVCKFVQLCTSCVSTPCSCCLGVGTLSALDAVLKKASLTVSSHEC